MSLPSWFNKTREENNRLSRELERKHAKQTGGRVQPGSGSSWRARQDVKSEEYLDQHKFTHSRSHTVSIALWESICKDAENLGREPRLILEFKDTGLKLVVTAMDNG